MLDYGNLLCINGTVGGLEAASGHARFNVNVDYYLSSFHPVFFNLFSGNEGYLFNYCNLMLLRLLSRSGSLCQKGHCISKGLTWLKKSTVSRKEIQMRNQSVHLCTSVILEPSVLQNTELQHLHPHGMIQNSIF